MFATQNKSKTQLQEVRTVRSIISLLLFMGHNMVFTYYQRNIIIIIIFFYVATIQVDLIFIVVHVSFFICIKTSHLAVTTLLSINMG